LLANARMTDPLGPPPGRPWPEDPPRPFVMPAGLPPGAEYIQEERAPEGVTYFRIYAIIMIVINALAALAGLVLMFLPLFSPKASPGDTEAWIIGLLYGGVGTVFCVPFIIALFGGRRPWVHTLGTVMIALAMTQICCLPILIPLLITWLKPETKRWYGAT
jgi:hypothetical protein